jgi:DNA topoisomerase I
MLEFAAALPAIRERIATDMSERGLGREKVLATVISTTPSKTRVTILTRCAIIHVDVQASELRFESKGKSGKKLNLKVHDRRIANIVRACQDLPGQHLFQYLDEQGERQQVCKCLLEGSFGAT